MMTSQRVTRFFTLFLVFLIVIVSVHLFLILTNPILAGYTISDTSANFSYTFFFLIAGLAIFLLYFFRKQRRNGRSFARYIPLLNVRSQPIRFEHEHV